MAKTYTSTINVNCWKEHTCISCGTVFSYHFIRKVTGRGNRADIAQRRAQAAVQKTLLIEVDLYPCPACGIVQPDMIAQKRMRWHRTTFWLTLIAFVTLLILAGTDVLTFNLATWIITGVGTLAALQLFGKELKNFNRDTEANLATAADRLARGTLKHPTGEVAQASSDWIYLPRSAGQNLAVPLLLLGVALLASPELLRVARHWPLNPETYPPVVGPSDQTRIYMHDKIESIKSYWRGTPQVTMNEAGKGSGGFTLQATTNQNNWGSEIQDVKSEDEHASSTPWVEIQLPADLPLAGKTVTCDIQLDIEYPQNSGEHSFQTVTSTLNRQVNLQLASAGAGTLYDRTWWYGGCAGMGVILFSALMLVSSAKRLRKKALPTNILSAA